MQSIVMVLGDPGTGKSSLILRYCDDIFVDSWISSVGARTITQKIGKDEISNVIYEMDASYEPNKRLKKLDSIIITVDMTNPESLQNLDKWLQDIDRYGKEDVVIAIAATKWDLVDERKITPSELEEYLAPHGIPFQLVSSKTGDGIQDLFKNMNIRVFYAVDDKYNQDKPSEPQASPEEMKELLDLIESKCKDFDYWKTKVRVGTAVSDNVKIPQAVSQILLMCQNLKEKPSEVLKQIGKLSEYKHSAHFQWAHSFFRGRDNQTNNFYGVLAQLDGANATSKSVVQNVLRELKAGFDEAPLETKGSKPAG